MAMAVFGDESDYDGYLLIESREYNYAKFIWMTKDEEIDLVLMDEESAELFMYSRTGI